MSRHQRTAQTAEPHTLMPPGGRTRALSGTTRWWIGLFLGLIALREALELSRWTWDISIPIWLVFLPLGIAFLVRPARADDLPPRTVSAPVEGRWTAINSPATKVPSHGVRTLGQAFAIDILHPSASSIHLGWGLRQRRPEELSCYGADVRAAQHGTVVSVHRDRRDHRARTTWPGIIFMLTVEAVCREIAGLRFVLGNHVVIDHADGSYALYAHLQRGSIDVDPGDSVTTGQVIGNVGNTGNTSEPHLHFQLMDRARPERAAGLPFRWKEITIEHERDPRWAIDKEPSTVEGLPSTAQVFRTSTSEPAVIHGME